MSATWHDVHFGGAVIGRAVYHNTSDIWFSAIVPEEAGKAGYSYSGINRRCMHEHEGPLHWVSIADVHVVATMPPRLHCTMLACLRCQALVTPAWDEDGYGYLPYTDAILARAANAEPTCCR